MVNNRPLLPFQVYQQAFSAHIRNPAQPTHPLLQAIPTTRLAVYEDIVYTNIYEAVSACFPVALTVLSPALWHDLVRGFLSHHSASSPLFRHIPAEFLHYLARSDTQSEFALPAYLTSLCHYEWVELAVSSSTQAKSHRDQLKPIDFSQTSTLQAYVAFAPSMQLWHYDYAVHLISPDYLPTQTCPTQLLVYMDEDCKVQFVTLNAVTLLLLQLLQGSSHEMSVTNLNTSATVELSPMMIHQALLKVAEVIPETEPAAIIAFGLAFLAELHAQGIVLGIEHAP